MQPVRILPSWETVFGLFAQPNFATGDFFAGVPVNYRVSRKLQGHTGMAKKLAKKIYKNNILRYFFTTGRYRLCVDTPQIASPLWISPVCNLKGEGSHRKRNHERQAR